MIIRVSSELWDTAAAHVRSGPGEPFAFLLARPTSSDGMPVFVVDDVLLVDPDAVRPAGDGWELDGPALIEVVNEAIRRDRALVEVHFHHFGDPPKLSPTDLKGIDAFEGYILRSLPGKPYGSLVVSPNGVAGLAITADGSRHELQSCFVAGDRIRQLTATGPSVPTANTDSRQLPWFGVDGQAALERTTVGVVGASGTGSYVVSLLALLGVGRYVIVDPDELGSENLSRIAYATRSDVGKNKAELAARHVKTLRPGSSVQAINAPLQTSEAIDALRGVDIVIGCVDNDGARLILNEMAVAYRLPYLDIGVGITIVDGVVTEAGGRLCVVVPGGPCLVCMGEIDHREAGYFLKSPDGQAVDRELGYVHGMDLPAPAVASINAAASSMLVNEMAVWFTGIREAAPCTYLDILGVSTPRAQRMTLHRFSRPPECHVCASSGQGDAASIQRYAI